MTEVQIINSMLAVVGESPVTSAESQHPSVVSARNVLARVNDAEQSRGWYFNTERDRILLPNSVGEILIPPDTLYIDSEDPNDELVPRGRVLWDNKNFTTIINREVRVRRIARIAYEDLPPVAADYIRICAVYEFFVEEDGEGSKYTALLSSKAAAYEVLRAKHVSHKGKNALRSPQALSVMYPFHTRNWRYR